MTNVTSNTTTTARNSARTVPSHRSGTLYILLLLLAGVLHAQSSLAAKPAPWVGTTLAGEECRGHRSEDALRFDYLTEKAQLAVVEKYHFTPQVEHLLRGQNSDTPIKDIDYTLSKYPNHPRALYSAVRFSLGSYSPQLLRQYPAECYLQRAVAFSPKDPTPHVLYGLYLHRLGKLDVSLAQYQAAEKLAPNDGNLMYNMGLLMFDRKNYPESYRYAQKAYDLGMEFPALRKKLEAVGYWKSPS